MSKPPGQKPAYIAWSDDASVYQMLKFDVVEDETWTDGADVTRHPVEVGAAISDNIRVRLRKCTLKVTATNEPVRSNQWSLAVIANLGTVLLTNQRAITLSAAVIAGSGGAPAISVTPGDGVVEVPEWDSQLQLRILAGTAAGLIGNAIGGTQGGTLGAIAGSALAGALLPGRVVPTVVATNAYGYAAPPADSISPNVLTFANPGDFVQQTIDALAGLVGRTVDVWGTKSNCIGPGASSGGSGPSGLGGMAITDLTHSRNAGMGTGASITITLEEIRIVYTTTVPAPAPAPTAADSTNPVAKGNQSPSELEAALAKIAAAAAAGFTEGEAGVTGEDPATQTSHE